MSEQTIAMRELITMVAAIQDFEKIVKAIVTDAQAAVNATKKILVAVSLNNGLSQTDIIDAQAAVDAAIRVLNHATQSACVARNASYLAAAYGSRMTIADYLSTPGTQTSDTLINADTQILQELTLSLLQL